MSNFYLLKRKIRFFFQKLIRGFDDSDTWDLEEAFYRWLLPRLKRFSEITSAYPMRCKSFGEWKKELEKRVKQLDMIVNVDDMDFNEYKYIPKVTLKKWLKEGTSKSVLNMSAKSYCIEDFNKWFSKNITELWW